MNSNNNDQKTLCNMLECDIDCTQDFYAYNIPIVKFDYNHFNLKCFITCVNLFNYLISSSAIVTVKVLNSYDLFSECFT